MDATGKTDVSIVIPLYNEEDSISELITEIRQTADTMNRRYEVILIDDGSTDNSFDVCRSIAETDNRIKVVRFRKNFGKSAALSEGFRLAAGDYVITLDADLQDDPAELPNLINLLDEGNDMVSGWKKKRRDPWTKRFPSKIWNGTTRTISGLKLHDFNCGLKAYRSKVIKSLKIYGELYRYIPVLAHLQGFAIVEIEVNHRARKFGKTKFGASRFFKGFLDLATVTFLGKYNRRPLHFFGILGGTMLVAGLAINLYLTFDWFTGRWIGNRPLLFLGILLMIVGVQFISLGLLGEMITAQDGDIKYSVSERIGFPDDD